MNVGLRKEIEIERKKLNELCQQKGSVLHPEVLLCSKKLDELIVKFLSEFNKQGNMNQ